MYSSKPILHSTNTPVDLVSSSKCGLSVEAENVNSIKAGILHLYNLTPKERADLGINGKKYVIANHSYSELANKYNSLI